MLKFMLLAVVVLPSAVLSSVVSLDNAFYNATYVFGKNFPKNTANAQKTILASADESAKGGPWSEFSPAFIIIIGPYFWCSRCYG